MTTPHTLPAVDRRRAATLLLGCLDAGGVDAVAAVIDEANEAPGGLQGLIIALVSGSLELLIGAAGGVDGARTHLNLQILNAEVDE